MSLDHFSHAGVQLTEVNLHSYNLYGIHQMHINSFQLDRHSTYPGFDLDSIYCTMGTGTYHKAVEAPEFHTAGIVFYNPLLLFVISQVGTSSENRHLFGKTQNVSSPLYKY